VVRKLGKGTFGLVVQAHDLLNPHRDVAIKICLGMQDIDFEYAK
jgi:hypothetical protein